MSYLGKISGYIGHMIGICRADGADYSLADAAEHNTRSGFVVIDYDSSNRPTDIRRHTLTDRQLKKAYAEGAVKSQAQPD